MNNHNYLLQELGKTLHCDITLDSHGIAEITLDQKIALIFEYNEELNVFVINIPLAKITTTDNATLACMTYELLCENYMCPNSGGTISIDKETDIICLHRMIELPMQEYVHFEDIVLNLASGAEYLMQYIEKMQNNEGINTEYIPSNALII